MCSKKKRLQIGGGQRAQWIQSKLQKKRRKGDDHQAENEEQIQEPFALECKHRVRLNWNLEIKMR